MLIWIIQTIIISFILIFLVHHLIEFFKSTLTVPKIKDLVNMPTQKYENIYSVISNNSIIDKPNKDDLFIDINKYENEPNQMKSQLKNFLKKQLNSNNLNNTTNYPTSFNISNLEQQTTNISYLDSIAPQGYSNY